MQLHLTPQAYLTGTSGISKSIIQTARTFSKEALATEVTENTEKSDLAPANISFNHG